MVSRVLCSQLEFAGRHLLPLLLGRWALGVFDLSPDLVLQLREEGLGGAQRLVLPLVLKHSSSTLSSHTRGTRDLTPGGPGASRSGAECPGAKNRPSDKINPAHIKSNIKCNQAHLFIHRLKRTSSKTINHRTEPCEQQNKTHLEDGGLPSLGDLLQPLGHLALGQLPLVVLRRAGVSQLLPSLPLLDLHTLHRLLLPSLALLVRLRLLRVSQDVSRLVLVLRSEENGIIIVTVCA